MGFATCLTLSCLHLCLLACRTLAATLYLIIGLLVPLLAQAATNAMGVSRISTFTGPVKTGNVLNQLTATITQINLDTSAIIGSENMAALPATEYLPQRIEFVDPALQLINHPILISEPASDHILDPARAQNGQWALGSFAVSNEKLDQHPMRNRGWQ